jgi:hypothetical protein
MTLLGHGDKVQGSVDTTWQLVHVDIKGELVTDEVEHFVVFDNQQWLMGCSILHLLDASFMR